MFVFNTPAHITFHWNLFEPKSQLLHTEHSIMIFLSAFNTITLKHKHEHMCAKHVWHFAFHACSLHFLFLFPHSHSFIFFVHFHTHLMIICVFSITCRLQYWQILRVWWFILFCSYLHLYACLTTQVHELEHLQHVITAIFRGGFYRLSLVPFVVDVLSNRSD